MGFTVAGAAEKKPRVCIGKVETVDDAKLTDTSKPTGGFIGVNIHITGTEGTSQDSRAMLLLKPEWLQEGFEVDKYDEEIPVEKTLANIYRKTIAVEGAVSALEGLVGGRDNLGELAKDLFAIQVDDEAAYLAAITEILRKHIITGQPVGYVLYQKSEKSGDRYVRTPYMQIGNLQDSGFFLINEKTLKNYGRRADKGYLVMCVAVDTGSGTVPF